MILILSTTTDPDTEGVLDWIIRSKTPFFRLNDEDLMSGNVDFCYNPKKENDSFLKQDDTIIYLKNVKVVWFRKFGYLKMYENEFGNTSDLVRYLYKELNVVSKLLYKILDKKVWLFKKANMLTKLEVLKIANDIGLEIPETIITAKKKILKPFFDQNKPLMSKSIGDGSQIVFKESKFYFYTVKIDSINNVPEKFTPALFQQYVPKDYELRIFYIDGLFYSMAIFSQNNEKTKIDFRNYDIEKPNRYEPYKLPKEIEKKIDLLMRKIGLNTGSIDMIRTQKGKYYFLEVNPSGQFGMTASPCNYPLYEKVADFLIRHS